MSVGPSNQAMAYYSSYIIRKHLSLTSVNIRESGKKNSGATRFTARVPKVNAFFTAFD